MTKAAFIIQCKWIWLVDYSLILSNIIARTPFQQAGPLFERGGPLSNKKGLLSNKQGPLSNKCQGPFCIKEGPFSNELGPFSNKSRIVPDFDYPGPVKMLGRVGNPSNKFP